MPILQTRTLRSTGAGQRMCQRCLGTWLSVTQFTAVQWDGIGVQEPAPRKQEGWGQGLGGTLLHKKSVQSEAGLVTCV